MTRAKDASNQAKHGVSLAEAARLDWDGMLVVLDTRHDYSEDRYRGIALLGWRLYSVVFTPRDETMRIISLRKASNMEIDAYEQD
ncbi:BrnT family toxin [Paraburkholderia phosphatilytica]|uniref:BrnT family toxin n=1 Tax=Paraburkholderia phosphatilytica TaxID=2282883 RepID=UPI000E4F053E